jgi:hypothetical protein
MTSSINFEAAFTPAPGSHPHTKVKLLVYEPVVDALPPSRYSLFSLVSSSNFAFFYSSSLANFSSISLQILAFS